MKKSLFISLIICSTISNTYAQDDLLNELEQEAQETHFQQPAFKAMKIGNLQSTKVSGKGDLYLYVSHRFGTLKDGLSTFLVSIMPIPKYNWSMG